MSCQQRQDGYIGKTLPLFCFVLFSPPLNSGLHLHLLLSAGHFSSFSDPFSVSLISVHVYELLVTVCQIQKEDINSSCFGTLSLSVRVIVSLPCHFLLTISFSVSYHSFDSLYHHVGRNTVFPLSHRSLLQRVAQSRLSLIPR